MVDPLRTSPWICRPARMRCVFRSVGEWDFPLRLGLPDLEPSAGAVSALLESRPPPVLVTVMNDQHFTLALPLAVLA